MSAKTRPKKSVPAAKIPRLAAALTRLFASNRFFWGVLIFLTLSAGFIALTSDYPMAFDEEVHVGLARAYSEVINPFDIVQKTEYDSFSSIVTDPSWLFHYLMSFPYRLLDAVGLSENAIIIGLRLINIALFVAAFWLFRKVLLAAGLSRAGTHVVLAIVALIPVVPLLAAHVNYDNLLMLVVAGLFWYAIALRNGLREHGRLQSVPTAAVIALATYGSVVKYAYLPIALGVVAYLLYELAVAWRKHGNKVWASAARDWTALSRVVQVVLFIAVVSGVFLFAQRYVLNIVQYGEPVPKCNMVLPHERCMAFGPYARNTQYALNKQTDFQPKSFPAYVAQDWYGGMTHRLYFALSGPNLRYETSQPLPIPIRVIKILLAGGLLLGIVYARRIFRAHPVFWLFVIPSVFYIGILMVQLYGAYVSTGRPVAINGRYLLPLLPGLGAIAVVAYAQLFALVRLSAYKSLFAALILLLLLQGGGPFTYIVRSRAAWYWPNTSAPAVAEQVQNAVRPFIYTGD